MGSVVKKIKKNVNKFSGALAALEKALAEANSELKPAIFNIKNTVQEEIDLFKNNKRKERNKRKAKKRLLSK